MDTTNANSLLALCDDCGHIHLMFITCGGAWKQRFMEATGLDCDTAPQEVVAEAMKTYYDEPVADTPLIVREK